MTSPDGTKKTASLKSLLGRIGKGDVPSRILIHGEEEYLVQETFQRVLEALLPEKDRKMNLVLMDGDETGVAALCQSLLALPLLPGRKVVAVRNTTLFQSRTTLPALVREMETQVEGKKDFSRVFRPFSAFLRMTGWSLEDLQDGNWRSIPPETWKKTAGVEDPASVEKWLPPILEQVKATGRKVATGPAAEGRLEEILERGLPPGHILVLSALSVDRRKKLYQLMAREGAVLAFDKEKGEARVREKFRRVALDYAGSRGKRITKDALDVLGEKTGHRLAEAVTVLESLFSLAGERDEVNVEDVASLAADTKAFSVFDLTGALAQRDALQALKALDALLRRGEPPVMIFAMVAREIRNILHARILLDRGLVRFTGGVDYRAFQQSLYPGIKSLGATRGGKEGGLPGQHPYVIFQAFRSALQFSREEAAGFFDRLAGMDLEMKTTGKDPAILLERFLLDVCR